MDTKLGQELICVQKQEHLPSGSMGDGSLENKSFDACCGCAGLSSHFLSLKKKMEAVSKEWKPEDVANLKKKNVYADVAWEAARPIWKASTTKWLMSVTLLFSPPCEE